MREFLAICLRRNGHDVTTVSNAEAALAKLRDAPFDIVVTDLRMPGELDGLGILKAIKSGAVRHAAQPGTTPAPVDAEVILVTAYATADTALAAMKHGAYDYLTKPFHVDEINAVIGRALEKRALVEANLALRDQRRRPRAVRESARQEPRDAEGVRADRQDPIGADERADHRRERHRQGAGRARAA